MGKPKVFQIVFSRPQPVYKPRDTVDGYLQLELDEEIKVQEISVELKGTSRVRWKDDKETRRGYECYIDTVMSVFGRGSGREDEPVIKPGSYRYPFMFEIPANCPSSFEEKTGHVRYVIRAVIDRPWKLNHTVEYIITVLRDLDLNAITRAKDALHADALETSCCCCCAAGPVSIKIDLDRAGYVPGESIPVRAEVTNLGRQTFKTVRAELVMTKSYHSDDGKLRVVSKTLATVKHNKLKAGDTDVWNRVPLRIPPGPPSYLIGCNIIDIKYFLRIAVGFFIKVPVQIIIGTVPLAETEDQRHQTAAFAPPTYSECVTGAFSVPKGDGKDKTKAESKYKPVYAYYDFRQSYHTFDKN